MELIDYLWSQLPDTEVEGVKTASEQAIENVYHRGLTDARRFSMAQWKMACRKFATGSGTYKFRREDLDSLRNYFFQGEIKKPFDPERMKAGPRPLSWNGELYQKVLRFETSLTLKAWEKIVQTLILPACQRGKELIYNEAFKDILLQILQEHASPLRRLEVWYHFEREQEVAASGDKTLNSEKKMVAVNIQDAFVAQPDEAMKKSAINKLYFHRGEAPKIDDRSNLDFLDELADLEGEEEGEL